MNDNLPRLSSAGRELLSTLSKDYQYLVCLKDDVQANRYFVLYLVSGNDRIPPYGFGRDFFVPLEEYLAEFDGYLSEILQPSRPDALHCQVWVLLDLRRWHLYFTVRARGWSLFLKEPGDFSETWETLEVSIPLGGLAPEKVKQLAAKVKKVSEAYVSLEKDRLLVHELDTDSVWHGVLPIECAVQTEQLLVWQELDYRAHDD